MRIATVLFGSALAVVIVMQAMIVADDVSAGHAAGLTAAVSFAQEVGAAFATASALTRIVPVQHIAVVAVALGVWFGYRWWRRTDRSAVA